MAGSAQTARRRETMVRADAFKQMRQGKVTSLGRISIRSRAPQPTPDSGAAALPWGGNYHIGGEGSIRGDFAAGGCSFVADTLSPLSSD